MLDLDEGYRPGFLGLRAARSGGMPLWSTADVDDEDDFEVLLDLRDF